MLEKNITIVITSFKSDRTINNCLKSISDRFRVIVIENSSNFLIKEKLESKYPNVTCVIAGENLGYAKGNNLGLSLVKSPYALILNPDTILHPDAIDNFFKTASNLKSFAIIAPAIQDEKNINNNTRKLEEVSTVKGFAMFFNISEFKNIGFFDKNFFIYLEEIDLCKRLKKENKKIFLDPTILIEHQGGSSHDEEHNFEMELSRNWHWMWSSFYFSKKYKGFIIAFLINFKKLFSSFFKYMFYLLIKNKKKHIYKSRMSGLINSILGKPSWYRPFAGKG